MTPCAPTRCEVYDTVAEGELGARRFRDVRCTKPAAWLHRRLWRCDDHARASFEDIPDPRDVPRNGPTAEWDGQQWQPVDWVCAPWVPAVLEGHIARLREHIPAPTLDLGAAS